VGGEPALIEVTRKTLFVGGRAVGQDEIDRLTYWTVEKTRKASTVKLVHHFRLALERGVELRGAVDVLHPDLAERQRRAAGAAEVVRWLQTNVETRIRQTLIDRVAAGTPLAIGRCDLTTAGFAHRRTLPGAKTHPWDRYYASRVTTGSIQILLNTDDPELGKRGFKVSRSELDAVMLPELMASCRERWGGRAPG